MQAASSTEPTAATRAPSDGATATHGDVRRGAFKPVSREGHSAFLPLVVFFAAATAWSGFQLYQLQLEGTTLTSLRSNQETQLEQAQKVRTTLDSLAKETQKLADSGNANARLVVEELRKRGITINRSAP